MNIKPGDIFKTHKDYHDSQLILFISKEGEHPWIIIIFPIIYGKEIKGGYFSAMEEDDIKDEKYPLIYFGNVFEISKKENKHKIITGNFCMKNNCQCIAYNGKKKTDTISPPFHTECDCYYIM